MTKVVNELQAYKRHITSERLADRYPYLEDITGHLKDDDVSMAFGDRVFPRLVEQLTTPGMQPDRLCAALRTICDLASNQEQKAQAIVSDVIAATTNLLNHDDIPVRRDAARVISNLALMIKGRSVMPAGNRALASNVAAMFEAGPTLPLLVKQLLGCEDELVKMYVAEALKSTTIFSDGCQQIVDQGAVRGIAQYLCATLPELPLSADLARCLLYLLQALASVTMYARNGFRDVFNVGLIAKVIGLLKRIPEDTGIRVVSKEESVELTRQALRFLWHCGNDQQGRVEMLKADGVAVVTRYLSDADAAVRETATCMLNVVALETQGKKDILAHSIGALSRLLHSKDETDYLHDVCVALCRCAAELPAFRYAFARHVLASTWLLEEVFGTATLVAVSPLLEPTEDTGCRQQAANVMSHFLRGVSACAGDKSLRHRMPPTCPSDHVDDPARYAMEECVDVLHNLVGLLEAAREPALQCLKVLLGTQKAQAELKELMADGRASVPDSARADIESLLATPGRAFLGEAAM
jgi:hypothetical protein